MKKIKNYIIGSLLASVLVWTTLILMYGLPKMSIEKIGILVFGVVATTLILFLVILFVDLIMITGLKRLVKGYKEGDSRMRKLIIISGILVLLRIMADIFR